MDIDGLGLFKLPRTGLEGVGLGSEGTDRAQVDDVTAELTAQVALEVGADLHIVTTASGAELGSAGDLVGETDATSALDTAVHASLHKRTNVLVLGSALTSNLVEPSSIATIAEGLVLEIALTTLVTNRAVKRVVTQDHLGNALLVELSLLVAGVDNHAVGHGETAARDGLAGLLHINETHTAVTSHGKLLVVAVARDLDAGLLDGLDERRASIDGDLTAIDGESDLLATQRSAAEGSAESVTPSGQTVPQHLRYGALVRLGVLWLVFVWCFRAGQVVSKSAET